jgi:multiple sugar transport system substrate-binding protein
MRQGARKAAVAITSIVTVAALTLSGCGNGDDDPSGEPTDDTGGTSGEPTDDTGGTSGEPTDDTGDTSGEPTEEQSEDALNTPTELTFWTWVPDIQDQVDMFMEEYPAINVTVENVGQGLDHYAKVRTAAGAGDGPDVVQLEYQFISSFAVTGELLDLTPYGAADIAGDYVPWVWNQVVANDQVLAIPQDSGPMGNLYREDIMTAAGVTEPPATWEDYKAAAEAVRANTDSYISNMAPGQGAGWLGLLWQAGVKPFAYDGDQGVTINVNSAEAKEVVAYWQDLIQNDLVSVDPDFNDEWYQGLNQGKYAGWLTAAWAPVFLSGAAADTSGLWRAAPLPQWNEDEPSSGNQGGSANAVLKGSENPIAAYELAKWINHAQEPALLFATQQNFFPTAISVLEDPEFAAQEPEFYGGQRVNELFAEISETVDTEWEWLPFMEFAYSSFNETFGAAVAAKGDLAAGLDDWQDALVDYGTQQGFTVNG